METKTDFAAQVAASEKAQAHAQEIQQTRVGGLGGSDAAILYKVGLNGLSALTATDHKRLAIMVGKAMQDNWNGNVYTNAGHAFEEWSEGYITAGEDNFEREKYLTQPLARNFKTFAHADFYDANAEAVIECKFVQKETRKVIDAYYAQLQWYYLLGAKRVILFHGTGTADPFEVEETFTVDVERDQKAIEILLAGIATLDAALTDGWEPDVVDKIAVTDTPEIVQQAFAKMEEIKETKKALDEQEKDAKKVLLEYVEGFGLSGIFATDGSKRQAIYTKAGEIKTFDVAKFAAEHPEIDLEKYYKKTKRAASINFK